MSDPVFGISITRIDNEPRPAVWSDMAVVGIIGTSPAAHASVFPLNTLVFIYSDDRGGRRGPKMSRLSGILCARVGTRRNAF